MIRKVPASVTGRISPSRLAVANGWSLRLLASLVERGAVPKPDADGCWNATTLTRIVKARKRSALEAAQRAQEARLRESP